MTPAVYGQAACLLTALLWALSLTLYRQPIDRFGARTINLAKCVVATVLQGLTVLALGQAGALLVAPPRHLTYVALSAIIGLVVGDTALFGSAARIGVHRTLLLQTLAPVFAAIVARLWQAERLRAGQAGGGLLILVGVGLVVAQRRDAKGTTAGWLWGGVALGVLAALGQGTGVVLAKAGMERIPVLPASFLRLATATVGMILISSSTAGLRRLSELSRSGPGVKRVLPAILMGTYLALFLMMAGISLAPASIAAVLLSTSPVFSLAIEAYLEKRWFTVRELAGTLLAVGGVGLLTAG